MNESTKQAVITIVKSKVVLIGASVILLYTLAGFFLAPLLIGHFIPGVLSERFDSVVSMEKVRINPYSLVVEVSKFKVHEPSGAPIVGFDRLHVNVQLSSLFRWALTFRDVILDGPFLNIVIDREGNLNLERLAGPEPESPAPAESAEDGRPPRILLYNIAINEARIDMTDTRQSTPAMASFHPLDIHFANISTLPEREGNYVLKATGTDGTVLEWAGQVTLHPLRSQGKLVFRDMPLETPWAFARSLVNILPPSGSLNLEVRYHVDLGSTSTIATLGELRLGIRNLAVQLEGEDGVSLSLPELILNVGNVDVPGGKVDDIALSLQGMTLGFTDARRPALGLGGLAVAGGTVDRESRSASIHLLELTDGIIDVIRGEDDAINLFQLAEAATAIVMPGRGENSLRESGPSDDEAPWSFFLETLSVKGFTNHFTDLTVKSDTSVVDLDAVTLTLSRFDGMSPSPFELGLRILQGGTITVSGVVDPAAANLEFDMEVENISLPVIQPYLAQVADLTMKSGRLSMDGSFRRASSGAMAYQGQMSVAELAIIEKSTGEEMVGWDRLRIPGFRFSLDPDGLEMDTLSLAGLRGTLIISDEGNVSVMEAFKSKKEQPDDDPSKKTSPGGGSDPFPVKIGRVVLDKGRLHFADFSLMPQFDTVIHELKGVITGVSSTPGARTGVDLNGRVDRYGSSKISGEMNFFDPKEFTDMVLLFNNLEMTNLTPYSGKFAGRRIDDGRLSLDLRYKIVNGLLDSSNKVVIESLILGERVESPDAVSLPLGLAVALLKDADGVINIGLPITGSLDDPQFRIGPLIWQVFTNLLSRIVTSPFRALASLLGGGEEQLNSILFERGSGSIPPREQEKLDKLLEALRQRPQLKLTITGRYNALDDGAAMRELQVRRAYAGKSGITLEPGEEPGPVDFSNPEAKEKLASLLAEKYGDDEYKRVCAAMAPTDGEGEDTSGDTEKSKIDHATAARMFFKALVEREVLEEGVLEGLADDRAAAIAAHMTGPGRLEPVRIATQSSEETGEDEPLSSVLELGAMDTGT